MITTGCTPDRGAPRMKFVFAFMQFRAQTTHTDWYGANNFLPLSPLHRVGGKDDLLLSPLHQACTRKIHHYRPMTPLPTAMKRFVLPQVQFCCMWLCRVQGRLSWAVQIISCATLVACVCLCLRGLRFYHLFNLHLSWMFAGEFPPRLKRVMIISLPWHTADVSGLTQWHKSCSNGGRWRFDWWQGVVYMLQSVCKKWATVR